MFSFTNQILDQTEVGSITESFAFLSGLATLHQKARQAMGLAGSRIVLGLTADFHSTPQGAIVALL